MIEITTFGYGHGDAPEADITLDARRLFRNPHHDPAMRTMTGLDAEVFAHVLDTPGVQAAVLGTAKLAYDLAHTTGRDVRVAVGCTGGRHRAPAMASAIRDELVETLGWAGVTLTHRDVHRPLLPARAHGDTP